MPSCGCTAQHRAAQHRAAQHSTAQSSSTHPYDAHQGLAEVCGIDRLHESIAVIYEGEEGHAGRGLSDPVQEAIFGTEHCGRPNNDLQEEMREGTEYQVKQFKSN